MPNDYIRRFGLVAVVVLALALGGCGNSKKGNGYGYAPQTHPGAVSSSQGTIG